MTCPLIRSRKREDTKPEEKWETRQKDREDREGFCADLEAETGVIRCKSGTPTATKS